MNAAIADYLRAFNFSGTSRNFDCTGADWVGMSHEISARYFVPLLQLSHALASSPPLSVNRTAARKLLAQARHKSHGLIMPFMEYPASAQLNSTFGKASGHWSPKGVEKRPRDANTLILVCITILKES